MPSAIFFVQRNEYLRAFPHCKRALCGSSECRHDCGLLISCSDAVGLDGGLLISDALGLGLISSAFRRVCGGLLISCSDALGLDLIRDAFRLQTTSDEEHDREKKKCQKKMTRKNDAFNFCFRETSTSARFCTVSALSAAAVRTACRPHAMQEQREQKLSLSFESHCFSPCEYKLRTQTDASGGG